MIVPVPLGELKAIFTAVEFNTDAMPIVGALGFVVASVDTLDEPDVPPELVAETVNLYDVFGINPDTVIGEDVPVPTSPKLLVTV